MSRFAALLCLLSVVRAEILTPPYLNLALGKKITASATCGDEGQELYCKLVGANADHDEHVIQGQVCDTCDLNNDAKKHPPEYAVDGLDTWWQSPPLSRGMKYNEVNLTIDLGQEFHVAYVFVRMGNSPRPGLWVLEKSTDYGKTFKPWQYFSDSPQDCERYFGKASLMPITRDDSVICSTEYSKIVPLEGGEIPISLLNSRPSANKYFNSSVLQEWTRATNVRLRLLRTKNLLGHLMSVARQDPTVTRRYFYSIKDISIGGRCMCNGHADTCDPAEPDNDASILVCRCQHNTCGTQCNECCPGYEQKKWRISQSWNKFACEPCNCHNHSTECQYDAEVDEKRLSLDIKGRYEGGGVCKNCQHNTEGINCNKCVPTYYRPWGKSWGEIDVCEPCNCDLHFSTGNCAEETGVCECRVEFNPPRCDSCSYGYYDYPNCKPCPCNLNGTEDKQCTPHEGLCRCKFNYAGNSCAVCADGYYSPECKSCECNMIGSVSSVCDKDSGNCTCKSKYAGRTCRECEAGYYNYPACKHCNCDVSGTQDRICDDVDGTCICKEGFGGPRCDQCIAGYFMEVRGRERLCVPCNCSPTGSTSTSCSVDGKCNCLANFGGKQCDQCSPGYYKFPECLPCNCDQSGSLGSTCDDDAVCHCKQNFDGDKCDRCKEQFYNYPACEECNCDPRGVTSTFAGCGSVPAGELCQCKDRVQGRICNNCKPLFWNLQDYNPFGCEECNCFQAGTLGGLGACDTKTGQCICKPHVGERQCDECKDGFYKLTPGDVFGCTECDCDPGGSIHPRCDKRTGQCPCHSRVEGRRCERPIRAHYFPTLHQFKYELEEGMTRSGPVRYRSNEDYFPGFSWKGYVTFSILQNEVINEVFVSSKSSLYRMVVRYANPLGDAVPVAIVSTPESPVDTQQTFVVSLKPTTEPQFVTVFDDNSLPAPFVMNPGNWSITFKTTKEILLDYFVLIPQQYYEATMLTRRVEKPCIIGDRGLCRQFAYPSLGGRPAADIKSLAAPVTEYLDDEEQLQALQIGSSEIPLLSAGQSSLQYNMKIEPNGPYVLIVEYVTPVNRTTDLEAYSNETTAYTPGLGTVSVRFSSGDGDESLAIVNLNMCPYTTPCRQVVVDLLFSIQIVNVIAPENVVYLDGEVDTLAGIKSIVAVPYGDWHLDYVTARPFCLRSNGRCEAATFSGSLDYKKVEAETGEGGERESRPPILDNSTVVVNLNPDFNPLRVETKVSTPDLYSVMIHYYQPHHPESTIGATLLIDNSTTVETTTKIEHCPSNSGCRALLLQGTTDSFPINDNITITFKVSPGQQVWVDYILLPRPVDANTALKESNTVDYTKQFLDKCANNHYYIADNETGFCRDSMFTITSEYNSGALACFCDFKGSTELECETFGGQCSCKPNVIGRTCSACRPGFFGFPNCRPCQCSKTAICDDNGMCICPKNVEGDNCDSCKPHTFNFDLTRGCDDCNCHPLGVVNNELQCDLDSGQCPCKPEVRGRTCSRCAAGHFDFPHCDRCSCAAAGTTSDVCDQHSALCHCKKYVTGQACESCKDGYFNLQQSNNDGCTKCYCFGKTTRCSSSYLSWAQLSVMDNWSVVNIVDNKSLLIFPLTISPAVLNESVIGVELSGSDRTNQKLVYFEAPSNYLGKRLTSYGGYLTYSIYYTSEAATDTAIPASDVIIASGNTYLVHLGIDTPSQIVNWEHSVKISEEEFQNLDGSAVTRDQLMNVLVNVTGIYIRATYVLEAVTTRLSSVMMDIAIDEFSEDRRATSVEECVCPQGYRGHSCEQCAEGHYRLSSGLYAGSCLPCQCNSHTNECDVNTGVCLNCHDNTMGEHCEQCVVGYYGDATRGKHDDCLICACPMPIASNNFAIGCDLSVNGSLISCDCQPGYGGPRCEFCAAGYYGEPEVRGDYCKPCNCSGNINTLDPGSCDSISGACLKCVNNTGGEACNLCAPGFYGDAVLYKNCTACSCDEFGMDHCDSSTGTCVCRPGVIGDRCDQCAPNYYGIESGMGCYPCDCGLASLDPQCDMITGQCKCATGVTGKHCENCAAGYWNYTVYGCDHCNCNTGYSVGFMCNADGHCQCLPNVIGEKCDRCPERWVLIPHEGCLECDSCTDALVYSVEDQADRLRNETADFKGKADTFFTTQRLNYIRDQSQLLAPEVAALQDLAHGPGDELQQSVQDIDTRAHNAHRIAEYAATDSDKQITRAKNLLQAVNETMKLGQQRANETTKAIEQLGELANVLELSQGPKQENPIKEANQILEEIKAYDLESKLTGAENVFTNATEQQERMGVFLQPVNEQAKAFEQQVNATREFKKKTDDMLEFIDLAKNKTSWAEKLNDDNKRSKVNNKVFSVTKLNTDAMNDLIDAAYDTNNASTHNVFANATAQTFDSALSNLTAVNEELKGRIEQWVVEIPDLTRLAREVMSHAVDIKDTANNLRLLAEREQNNQRTQDAYAAASAYTSIVQEITDAKTAAENATKAVNTATAINHDLKENVVPVLDRSRTLLSQASNALNVVETDLSPNLTSAEQAIARASAAQEAADFDIKTVQVTMPVLPQPLPEMESQKADQASAIIRGTLATLAQFSTDLDRGKNWALSLPKTAHDATKSAANVDRLIKDIDASKAAIQDKLEAVARSEMESQLKEKQADEDKAKLKRLIDQARAVANRIQVGVSFDKRTTLQPRLPATVDEMSTTTRVSAYFRTRRPTGLLLYLGNPRGTNLRRTNSDDYLIAGVSNGYPYVLMDIGDNKEWGGDGARLTGDKRVDDNKWYQLIVDRVGRNVKLSIRESLDNGTEYTHSKEAVLPGTHTIFNLDKEKSKLFVGGAPSIKGIQHEDMLYFEGQIEELVIGDTPVGLWNFESANHLTGARQREKLITSQSGPQEYRFNGLSRVIMNAKPYQGPHNNNLLLLFRTYAPDGLIYLVGNGSRFFNVQMQGGKVYLQVSLGSTDQMSILGTDGTYNDGKWHRLDATRSDTICSLRVDHEFKNNRQDPILDNPNPTINVDTMNFGGNNEGIVQVANTGFDGCLRQISIDRVDIDLSDNIESVEMGYGCQFASLVSLSGSDSFLRFENVTSENLQLTLKFKTSEPNGLIFVYVSRTQTAAKTDSISLSLVNGVLELRSQALQVSSGSQQYNDSQWHVVTVTHGASLSMLVDDYHQFVSQSDTKPDLLYILNGVLFLGGIQEDYVITSAVPIGSRRNFRGCIADATVNGAVLNLLTPYTNNRVTFARCGTTITTGGVTSDQSVSWSSAPHSSDVLPLPGPAPPTQAPPEETTLNTPWPSTAPPAPPSSAAPPAARAPPPPASLPPPTSSPPPEVPPPAPEPGCALAYNAAYERGTPEEGYRFGTRNDSRIEYASLPGRQSDGFDLGISLRTFDAHGGLVFYARGEDPGTFLAVYLKHARVHFAFNCGGDTALVSSARLLNDTLWHLVTVVRAGGHGKLAVDGERAGDATAACAGRNALVAPYSYGGLGAQVGKDAHAHLDGFYQPFKGCLKGLMMNGQYATDVLQRVNSLRCTDNVEDGVYFGPSSNKDSNYLKLMESFRIGNEVSISMEIKPRNSTGLLLSVHGKKDFLILELLENEVVANVENGLGPFHASYKLGNKFSLCDGKWHKIHAVKSRHVVTVGVDGHFSDAGLGHSSSTDTRSALYIGGHERPISKVRGVRSKRGFTGCIRNITIRSDRAIAIPLSAAGRNTHIGACPND